MVKKVAVRPFTLQKPLVRRGGVVKKVGLGESMFGTRFTKRASEFLKKGKPELAIGQYIAGRSANGFLAYDVASQQFKEGKTVPIPLFNRVAGKISDSAKLESMAKEIICLKEQDKLPAGHAGEYLSAIASRSLKLTPDQFPAVTEWHEKYGRTPQMNHLDYIEELTRKHVPAPISVELRSRISTLLDEVRRKKSAKA